MINPILSELKAARPMSFQRRNKTLESQGLCSAVTSTILGLEIRQRARKAKDKKTFRLAVELIVADLMVSAGTVESRWAYRSLCNDKFSGERIKAITFRKVMGLLEAAGYAQQARGGNHSNPFHVAGGLSKAFNPGLACRYRATDSLLAVASQHGVEGGRHLNSLRNSIASQCSALKGSLCKTARKQNKRAGNDRKRLRRGV